jgi:acetyltransferase-like isoleucine patch superfamily enzyme
MPIQPDRDLKPTPEAEAIYRRWLTHLNDEFGRHAEIDRRSEIVRDELFQIYLGRPHGGRINATLTSELATSIVAESFDPRNVTLAAECAPENDLARYGPRKPLIYLWQMFDRSPLGINQWLGFRLRCMLGKHIFKHVGKGVKIYPNVAFHTAYDLTIEDNCTIFQGATLDDLHGLTLPEGTTVPAFSTFNGSARQI